MIFTTGGAGALLLLALATLLRLPRKRRDAWLMHGLVGGLIIGLTFYLTAVFAQAAFDE